MKQLFAFCFAIFSVIDCFAQQNGERLKSYTREGFNHTQYVADSFVFVYLGTHSSQWDDRWSQYLPSYDPLNNYQLNVFAPDFPIFCSTLPVPEHFFFNWTKLQFDSLKHYRRDSANLPPRLFELTVKKYGGGKSDLMTSAELFPFSGSRLTHTRCIVTYNPTGNLDTVTYGYLSGANWVEMPQKFYYNSLGAVVKDSSSGEPETYGYNTAGLADTITQKVYNSTYSKWIPYSQQVFFYNGDSSVNSWLVQKDYYGDDSLSNYSQQEYYYIPGTKKISRIDTRQGGYRTPLRLSVIETRHFNADTLPDTIRYVPQLSGFYIDYYKIFKYDSLKNPVSITLYRTFNPSLTLYNPFEERFYYEKIPALGASPYVHATIFS